MTPIDKHPIFSSSNIEYRTDTDLISGEKNYRLNQTIKKIGCLAFSVFALVFVTAGAFIAATSLSIAIPFFCASVISCIFAAVFFSAYKFYPSKEDHLTQIPKLI